MNAKQAMSDEAVAAVLRDIGSPQSCGCHSDPVAWLREDSAIYRGRGTVEVERLRADVMVRLAAIGLADAVLPYVLEELETGREPYALAAAARVAHGVAQPPPEMPRLLLSAIQRIRHIDQFVHFGADAGLMPVDAAQDALTAVDHLVESLLAIRQQGQAEIATLWEAVEEGVHVTSYARSLLREATSGSQVFRETEVSNCCHQTPSAAPAVVPGDLAGSLAHSCCEAAGQVPAELRPDADAFARLRNVHLENQDGALATFGQIFGGRPSVIGFFYTRCMNPNKCSRTISTLARLQSLFEQAPATRDMRVAAITYDPDYDTAPRLRRYGLDRHWSFNERCQLLRSTGSFGTIAEILQLGVGYGPATVNRHRLELLLLDASGLIVDLRVRRIWNEGEILRAVSGMTA